MPKLSSLLGQEHKEHSIWQTLEKNDLDKDRLGVFWALLFLSSENKIEIKQINSLYGPIQIKRILPDGGLA